VHAELVPFRLLWTLRDELSSGRNGPERDVTVVHDPQHLDANQDEPQHDAITSRHVLQILCFACAGWM